MVTADSDLLQGGRRAVTAKREINPASVRRDIRSSCAAGQLGQLSRIGSVPLRNKQGSSLYERNPSIGEKTRVLHLRAANPPWLAHRERDQPQRAWTING